MQLLSIIVPAKNEAPTLPALIEQLTQLVDDLPQPSEIIFVDDGSTDQSWPIVADAARRDGRVHGIRLSRNFGHQAALTAGLASARGDGAIIMDADLQHPPQLIPALLARAAEGYDVVYAVRARKDRASWFKRTSAALFYSLFNTLSGLQLPPTAGDFRYMSRPVVDALLAMPERHRFLRGMTKWVGFNQAVIEYERPPRSAGRSKYTLPKMLTLAWDGIIGFSALPLQLASVLGFAVSLAGFAYLAYAVTVRLFSTAALPGWTSVIVAVLIIGGAQLICLGLIGQYLARVYDETKQRPTFIIAEATPTHPTTLTLSRSTTSSRAQHVRHRPARRPAPRPRQAPPKR